MLQRFDEAINDYDKVISLRPEHEVALSNRGHVLQKLGDLMRPWLIVIGLFLKLTMKWLK